MARQTLKDDPTTGAKAKRRRALGIALRNIRTQAELTQGELGEMLANTTLGPFAIPQTTISRWEAGTVELELEQVFGIEQALKLRKGTLAAAAGYYEMDPGSSTLEEMLRTDSRIHADVRDELIRIVNSYLKTSKTLKVAEERLARRS